MTDFHGAAGNISRFLVGSEIDDVDLLTEVRGMARIFDPLMQATRVGNEPPVQLAMPTQLAGQTNFASITARALTLFRDARTRPYTTVPELWKSMDALASWFGETWAVNRRPHIFAKWSLGRGNWASVPWLALMNRNVTTSTQYGLYVVLLVSEDLSTIYLTLNQGMTKLVAEHGEQKAVQILKDRADRYRQQINILEGYGYTLDNEIDLKTQNWRASNYQPSTIAYMEFDTTKLPGDDMLGAWLEPLLEAYDTLVQFDNENAEPIMRWITDLGEGLYGRGTPDGYPLEASAWSGPSQMEARFEVARQIGLSSAKLFRPPALGAAERPAFPLFQNALYFGGLVRTLSPESRAALDQADSPQEWNMLYLSSPEFMRR